MRRRKHAYRVSALAHLVAADVALQPDELAGGKPVPPFAALLLVSFIAVAPAVLRADCGDDPGDGAAVAAARAEVDAECACAGAPTHDVFVHCAREVVARRVGSRSLRRACRAAVVRCAARSTCGKPGAVACCRTDGAKTRCQVEKDAATCQRRHGGCADAPASCCDACVGGGCSTTTTTLVGVPCESSLTCAGDCGPGPRCAVSGTGSPTCACFPLNVTPCSEDGYPTCAGACLGGRTCQAVGNLGKEAVFGSCACVDPEVQCGTSCESLGTCAAGEACVRNVIAPIHCECLAIGPCVVGGCFRDVVTRGCACPVP